jgi:hypothetical protein
VNLSIFFLGYSSWEGLILKLDVWPVLSKLGFSPQSRKERQEVIFLFGGERPPNKKPFFAPEKAPFAARERSHAI